MFSRALTSCSLWYLYMGLCNCSSIVRMYQSATLRTASCQESVSLTARHSLSHLAPSYAPSLVRAYAPSVPPPPLFLRRTLVLFLHYTSALVRPSPSFSITPPPSSHPGRLFPVTRLLPLTRFLPLSRMRLLPLPRMRLHPSLSYVVAAAASSQPRPWNSPSPSKTRGQRRAGEPDDTVKLAVAD
ncbi:uncharacterized protein SCHCODRAFT_02180607 [Schizophyllum commune H4-8]|uniref:uncharacterized protein n=1 Tax=Schizophyllum commune (strain H4-8 / FGSC 9210) TaxID=578458 RepID=UPI00215F583C|nr:uncharacterized protein SCHCODRAFT_02180607 [Schizophyllum commune H4-8]KAI5895988.1 hypothetical protein SCHCODRAFT_02180607 [Schizophyllum commune H4-8]